MNNFFKMLFASCLGVALGLALLGLIGVFVIGALAGQSSKPKAVPSNTVLHLKFDKLVPELTNNADMQSILEVSEEDLLGLTDIVEALRRAKKDDHIKGIFLETDMSLISGFATTRVLRTALHPLPPFVTFLRRTSPPAFVLSSCISTPTPLTRWPTCRSAPLGLVAPWPFCVRASTATSYE